MARQDTHVSDFRKSPIDIVIDLVNADNGISLESEKVRLNAPKQDGARTSVKIDGVPLAGTKGSQTVSYDRVGIQEIPQVEEVIFKPVNTLQQVVDAVNERHSVNFTTGDVLVDGKEITSTDPVVVLPNQPATFNFVAKATSFVWKDSYEFKIQGRLPYDITEMITLLALDGLYSNVVVEPNDILLDFPVQKNLHLKEFDTQYPDSGWARRPVLSADGSRMVIDAVRPIGNTGKTGLTFFEYNVDTSPPTLLREWPMAAIGEAMFPGDPMVITGARFCELLSTCWFSYTTDSHGSGVAFYDFDANQISDFKVGYSYDKLVFTRKGQDMFTVNTADQERYLWLKKQPNGSWLEAEAFATGAETVAKAAASNNISTVISLISEDGNLYVLRMTEHGSQDISGYVFPTPDFTSAGNPAMSWTMIATDVANFGNAGYFVVSAYDGVGAGGETDVGLGAFIINNGISFPIGKIPSVMKTNELYGELKVGNIRIVVTKENEALAFVVYTGNTGRPGQPGQGAVGVYRLRYNGTTSSEFYSVGDIVQSKWTKNGVFIKRGLMNWVAGAVTGGRGLAVAGESGVEAYWFKPEFDPSNS